jgi:uncharacterized MAPEG superfamily protein
MVGASYYEQLLFAAGKGTYNASFYAIPAMWVLSMIPHFYAAALSKGQFKNSTPRGYLAEVHQKKQKTPTDEKYIRAEAAQQNGHENLPFMAAAILAGNYVSSDSYALEKKYSYLILTPLHSLRQSCPSRSSMYWRQPTWSPALSTIWPTSTLHRKSTLLFEVFCSWSVWVSTLPSSSRLELPSTKCYPLACSWC